MRRVSIRTSEACRFFLFNTQKPRKKMTIKTNRPTRVVGVAQRVKHSAILFLTIAAAAA